MRLLNLTSSALGVLLFGSFIFINGCSSDGETRPEYMDAATTQNLEIPPQLTQPDTRSALQLPEPSAKAKAAFANASSGDSAVKEIAPVFKGLNLKNESRLYWLEIDSPIEKVWDSLPYFLAAEGIVPERVEKLLGYVDTQWMNEYQISYGGEKKSSWWKKFSPDYKDKFRLRLEKVDNNKTRLFVSHRGLQIVVTDDANRWAQRDSEPMLERELMYRYMLFAGADEKSATDLLAGYKSFQPRVISSNEQPANFQVRGGEQIVWRRLKSALDRLGVEVVKTDEKNKNIAILVGNLKTVDPAASEGSSWFARFFAGEGEVYDIDEEHGSEGESENREFKKASVKPEDRVGLTVQQVAGPYISEIILKSDGELKGIALDFRDALLNQLE